MVAAHISTLEAERNHACPNSALGTTVGICDLGWSIALTWGFDSAESNTKAQKQRLLVTAAGIVTKQTGAVHVAPW